MTTPEGAWKTALTLFLAHGYVGKDHLRNSSGRYVWIDSNLAERSRLPLPLSLDGNISAGAVANILWHFGRRLGNFQNGTDSVGFEIIIEFLQNDFRPPGRDVTLRDFMDSWACARPDDLGNVQSALAEYEIPYAAPLCQQ